MATLPESGVLKNEQGFRCPDMQRFNFLPFAPEENLDALINVSGFNGPIPQVGHLAPVNQLSGVLGNGSLYPGSGSLEQLSRLFWCVKAWSLNVTIVTLQVPASSGIWSDPFDNFIAPLSAPDVFKQCFIQNSFDAKTLHLTDIYGSGTFIDPTQSLDSPANNSQLKAHAIPLDPIMSWHELSCRNRYFSWAPPPRLQTGFYTMNVSQETNSPYIMTFDMFANSSDPLQNINPPSAYGMWNLSIMNSDAICRERAIKMPTGAMPCIIPSGTGLEDVQAYSLAPQFYSGALIDDTGRITGYGYHPIVSGCPPVLAHWKTYDPKDPTTSGRDPNIFNPDVSHTYFPLIYFMLRLRSAPIDDQNQICAFAADICSLQPQSGWNVAGTFVIYDSNITGYSNTLALKAQQEIFKAPLYAPGANANLFVSVTLTPNQYWINQSPTESGTINY